MQDDQKRKEALRKQLDEVHEWPSMFMFKFIIPSDEEKMTQLRSVFNESIDISTRKSGKGNYTAVTIKEMVLNADAIFARYEAASKIQGIISL